MSSPKYYSRRPYPESHHAILAIMLRTAVADRTARESSTPRRPSASTSIANGGGRGSAAPTDGRRPSGSSRRPGRREEGKSDRRSAPVIGVIPSMTDAALKELIETTLNEVGGKTFFVFVQRCVCSPCRVLFCCLFHLRWGRQRTREMGFTPVRTASDKGTDFPYVVHRGLSLALLPHGCFWRKDAVCDKSDDTMAASAFR